MPMLWKSGAALSRLRILAPERIRIVRDNLRTVLKPETTEAELEQTTREVFACSMGNLLSSLKTSRLSMEELKEIAVIEDREVLDRAIAKGRGVFIVLAHMGNWELLAQIHELLFPGTPGGTFYRPLNNPYLDRVIADRRRQRGVGLFAKRSSLKEPIKLLREGGVVSVLSDQRAGRLGSLCPFFGRLFSANPLPALLQKRTGCEVVGLSVRTTEPGRWAIKLHPATPDSEAWLHLRTHDGSS